MRQLEDDLGLQRFGRLGRNEESNIALLKARSRQAVKLYIFYTKKMGHPFRMTVEEVIELNYEWDTDTEALENYLHVLGRTRDVKQEYETWLTFDVYDL